MSTTTINVKRIVNERFGGRTQLATTLRISRRAVDKWIERNTIPGNWWPELYALADQEGVPLDLLQYVEHKDKGGSVGNIFD